MSNPNSTIKIVGRIAEIESDNLLEFVSSLSTVFSSYSTTFSALYSPSILHPNTLHLIASSCDAPKSIGTSSASQASLYLDVSPTTQGSLFLFIQSLNNLPQSTALRKCIASKLRETIYRNRQEIRRTVIEQSVRSRDINSFVYRLVRAFKESHIPAEELSVFIWDNRQKKIYLSATTSELRRIKAKDIYYKISDQFPTVQAIVANRATVEDTSTHFIKEEFDSHFSDIRLSSRGTWPISLVNSNFSDVSSKEISPIGAIRISNPNRITGQDSRRHKTEFTFFDDETISFICEVMFVLLQIYVQYADVKSDFARLTHGLGSNVDATLKFAAGLRESLFEQSEEEPARPKFRLPAAANSDIDDVYYNLSELEHFLGDLHFQFEKGDQQSYKTEVVDQFHTDVLMPAARLVPAIAAANSRRNPTISNFKESGSLSIPRVLGNKEGFISVLRNLFENSIKYTDENRARIDVSFVITQDVVTIDYRDSGIGIAENETEQVFVEGYRSVRARLTSNRGIGIGLTYSRDVMRSFGGDLECIASDRGAHFRITIKRYKGT
ncbi:MAG: ATP-binding protein [Pseudomonadota bacterium]